MKRNCSGKKNKIPYKDGNFIIKTIYSSGQNRIKMWVDVIQPLTHVFDLKEEKRKKLFSIYKETMIAKLNEAINALEKAMEKIWNDKTRIPRGWNCLNAFTIEYEQALKEFETKHHKTGEHKLLYPLLKHVVDKLHEAGISDYRLLGLSKDSSPLYSLFEIFGYGNFEDATSALTQIKCNHSGFENESLPHNICNRKKEGTILWGMVPSVNT